MRSNVNESVLSKSVAGDKLPAGVKIDSLQAVLFSRKRHNGVRLSATGKQSFEAWNSNVVGGSFQIFRLGPGDRGMPGVGDSWVVRIEHGIGQNRNQPRRRLPGFEVAPQQRHGRRR